MTYISTKLTVTQTTHLTQVDRRQVVADWRPRVSLITAKAETMLKSLPPDVAAALPEEHSATDAPDYALCCAIRDTMVRLGMGERSMFGGLKGEAGAWDKLCRAYEKGSTQQ